MQNIHIHNYNAIMYDYIEKEFAKYEDREPFG